MKRLLVLNVFVSSFCLGNNFEISLPSLNKSILMQNLQSNGDLIIDLRDSLKLVYLPYSIKLDMSINNIKEISKPEPSESNELSIENSISKEAIEYNEVALKIAGLGQDEYPEYKQYAEQISTNWNKLWETSLSEIPQWSEKHISAYTSQSDTVFYPFGGPDISYALAFFAKATRYILIGLEPLGNFPKIREELKNPQIYPAIQTACTSYLQKGYFITSEMCTQLSNNNVYGGLNLILLQLARLDYKILSVISGGIDETGIFVLSNKGNIDCIKIICEKNNEKKDIYYMRMDLSNSNSKFKNLREFTNSFNFVTLVKSASYAMHDRNFSKIRQLILDNSKCILQDDTGIPFYFFKENWKCKAFGNYTVPTLKVFHSYYQRSLSNFFQTSEHINIPFKIGYGFRAGRPNLLLATPNTKTALNH